MPRKRETSGIVCLRGHRTPEMRPWECPIVDTRSLDFQDRHGDRLRPLVAPAGEARGPAPRAAAGADKEDVVRVLEEGAPGRLVAGRHLARQARGALEVGDTAARVLDQEALDVASRPPAPPEDFRMLAGRLSGHGTPLGHHPRSGPNA